MSETRLDGKDIPRRARVRGAWWLRAAMQTGAAALVVALALTEPVHADMELAPPPEADFEAAAPEIASPPPTDMERAAPEIADEAPPQYEEAAPEIAPPPPADAEAASPEISDDPPADDADDATP